MELITEKVENQFIGQETRAAHAGLLASNIQVSIDGRGRALDSVFCERLSSSVRFENKSLNQYDLARQHQTDLTAYFDSYGHKRTHPPKCTSFFPIRDLVIGANDSNVNPG
ncbi:MAG: hypothetical protein OXC27_05790 [Caldilineaceae bacterium]|nr:hypothetical protein [Caldilineaceae bacterium]